MALGTGLLTYWKMENDVTDEQGNHDGTNNGASFVAGNTGFGQAADFDGVNDYVMIGTENSTASNNLQPSAGSMSAWVWMDTLKSGIILGASADNNTPGANANIGPAILSWKYSNKLYFYVNVGNGLDTNQDGINWGGGGDLAYTVATNSDGGYNALIGTWVHLVMTWENPVTAITDLKIYVNGTNAGSSGSPSIFVGSSFDAGSWKANREFLLGMGNRNGAGAKSQHNGKLDDIAVWSRVLTSTEVQEIYDADAPLSSLLTPAVDGSGFRITVV